MKNLRCEEKNKNGKRCKRKSTKQIKNDLNSQIINLCNQHYKIYINQSKENIKYDTSYIEKLPPEIIENISFSLSPSSAGKLARTSERMREQIKEFKVRKVSSEIYGGKYLDQVIKEKKSKTIGILASSLSVRRTRKK